MPFLEQGIELLINFINMAMHLFMGLAACINKQQIKVFYDVIPAVNGHQQRFNFYGLCRHTILHVLLG
jgi:hypothetical protein